MGFTSGFVLVGFVERCLQSTCQQDTNQQLSAISKERNIFTCSTIRPSASFLPPLREDYLRRLLSGTSYKVVEEEPVGAPNSIARRSISSALCRRTGLALRISAKRVTSSDAPASAGFRSTPRSGQSALARIHGRVTACEDSFTVTAFQTLSPSTIKPYNTSAYLFSFFLSHHNHR